MLSGNEGFRADYESYVSQTLHEVQQAADEVLARWTDATHWSDFRTGSVPFPNPVQRVKSRIKRPESVIDKLRRMRNEFPQESAMEAMAAMRDMFGARIIAFVPQHMALVDHMIRMTPELEVDATIKPRAYLDTSEMERIGLDLKKFEPRGRKPSGYSSLHYFLRVKLRDGSWSSIFELQVRTMVEEVWGEIEHQLGYKTNQRTEFSVTRQFRVISAHLAAINEHFDFLYDRLTYIQSNIELEGSAILNAENLPVLLAEYEIPISQDELGSLLDILNVWEVETVSQLRERLTQQRLDSIRAIFRATVHDEVMSAFHVLSTLSMVAANAPLDEVEKQLRANLAMVELTRKTRSARRQGSKR